MTLWQTSQGIYNSIAKELDNRVMAKCVRYIDILQGEGGGGYYKSNEQTSLTYFNHNISIKLWHDSRQTSDQAKSVTRH